MTRANVENQEVYIDACMLAPTFATRFPCWALLTTLTVYAWKSQQLPTVLTWTRKQLVRYANAFFVRLSYCFLLSASLPSWRHTNRHSWIHISSTNTFSPLLLFFHFLLLVSCLLVYMCVHMLARLCVSRAIVNVTTYWIFSALHFSSGQ